MQSKRSLRCLYREFLEFFVWKPAKKKWTQRKRKRVIGRLVTVSPNEGDRYYLRLLLSHIRAPTCFEDLLTVNGKLTLSYREAAFQMGLLQSDTHLEDTFNEAAAFQMPSSLRNLFAVLLAYCSPSNPKVLWEKYEAEMSKDFERAKAFPSQNVEQIRRCVLLDVNKSLEQMGKNFNDYHVVPDDFILGHEERLTREIQSELNIEFTEEDLLLLSKLNVGQKRAYDVILQEVFSSGNTSFFVDGPGGTGKTFLYRVILATLRSQGFIAIAVASSGVAASIRPGGRTAHSRFKIPLDISKSKVCHISKQSSVAKLVVMAKLILWDEASMAKKDTIETFDRLLRDVMDSDLPFGSKVIVFGGDFRQTLPVIQSATKDQQIEASFVNSPLWTTLQKLILTENMTAISDRQFSNFLLRIGEGREPEDKDGKISLGKDISIPFDNRSDSLNRLVDFVFSNLSMYLSDPYQITNRCILTPKNACVDDINEMMIDRFSGQPFVYMSTDRTINERDQLDYEDFLNSLNPKGLPPHKLVLKEGCPVILLRNLNPTEGLCNGTRLICRQLKQHAICAEIAVGQHRGKRVLLPRIPLQTTDNEKNGILFKRTQFPIKLCFAMTINKSQGQTLDRVGIYLREPVFSHGQLYVALSRARTSSAVRVLILPGTFNETVTEFRTRNVVFHEIFRMAGTLYIDEIVPGMKSWTAEVIVQEKFKPGSSTSTPTKFQRLILADSKGSRVQGILFNYAIQKMEPKLQLYKKYRISNAEVKKIPEKFRTDDIELQWVIGTQTVVEEIENGETNVLPLQFTFTPFSEFARYADSKTETVDVLGVVIDVLSVIPINKDSRQSFVQKIVIINQEMNPIVLSLWNDFIEAEGKTITEQKDKYPVVICRRLKVFTYAGIALSTRNDSVILINPPVRDANQLKHWAVRNDKSFSGLVQKKSYTNYSPKTFHDNNHKVTSLVDITPAQKVSWVKACFSFEHILQKYWYMSCIKCRRMTSANYDSVYTCNHCSEKQKAVPRCRFDVDLIDETDTITASVFGELAESLLKFTALEAMECYNENEELPLEKVHRELKEKMFIAQLKPGNTSDGGEHDRYTIAYFFEENAATSSFNKDSRLSIENQFLQTQEQDSEAGSSEGQRSSSKARVRLTRRFKDAGEMDKDPTGIDDSTCGKKAKIG